MRIQVIGPGCARCQELAKRTEKAVEVLGLDAVVEKITDLNEMLRFRIMATPALAVDGTVLFAGKVPNEEDIRTLLASARA